MKLAALEGSKAGEYAIRSFMFKKICVKSNIQTIPNVQRDTQGYKDIQRECLVGFYARLTSPGLA